MDNYTEETQPLFKLMRTPAFRFVVVRFNHYSLVRQLQSDLRAQFADRKVSIINTEKATYQEILKTYLDQEEGFLFLENFEDILKRDADSQGKVSPEMAKNNQRRSSIAAGLNMRRDKLAKYPIAIVAFVFASAGELYARSLMEKMPDLWSFRSLLLDLKQEQEASTAKKIQHELQWEPTPVSTLGGNTREEKLSELNRLLNEVKATPNTETNYLRTLYEQIAELQKETGQYDEAIKTIDYLIKNSTNLEDNFWLLIDIGDLHYTTGILDEAQNAFKIANEIADSLKNDYLKGIALLRLGNIYCDLRDHNNALILQDEAMFILQKLYGDFPANKDYKYALSISYSKLGETHLELSNFDKALYYFKEELILFKELSEAYPLIVDYTMWSAISYQNIGVTHSLLGNIDKALNYLEIFNRLTKELNEAYPQNEDFKNGLAISYEKLGNAYFSLGHLNEAITSYEKDFQIAKELFSEFPQNISFKIRLAISYENLGNFYFLIDNLDSALSNYIFFNDLMIKLNEAYPQNLDIKIRLAISHAKLGEIYCEKLNKFQSAKEHLLKAKLLWSELVTISSQDTEFKRQLEQVELNLASLS